MPAPTPTPSTRPLHMNCSLLGASPQVASSHLALGCHRRLFPAQDSSQPERCLISATIRAQPNPAGRRAWLTFLEPNQQGSLGPGTGACWCPGSTHSSSGPEHGPTRSTRKASANPQLRGPALVLALLYTPPVDLSSKRAEEGSDCPLLGPYPQRCGLAQERHLTHRCWSPFYYPNLVTKAPPKSPFVSVCGRGEVHLELVRETKWEGAGGGWEDEAFSNAPAFKLK